MSLVRLSLEVRDQANEEMRNPQPVFDLDVHVDAQVADVVCSLVMRALADRNATELTLPRAEP